MLERKQTLNCFKLQRRQGPENYLELVAVFSVGSGEQTTPEKFYLDVEEQVSTEIFLVENQASPEKFYLVC